LSGKIDTKLLFTVLVLAVSLQLASAEENADQSAGRLAGRQQRVSATYLGAGSVESSAGPVARLTGDGSGNLTQAPVFLRPTAMITVKGSRQGCLAAGFPLYLVCDDMAPNGVRAGRRHLSLADSALRVTDSSAEPLEIRSSGNRKMNNVTYLPAEECVIRAEFEDTRSGTFHTQFDPGDYHGAGVYFMSGTFSYSRSESPFMGNSTWHGLACDGRWRIEWLEERDSLSLRVRDETRGAEVAFSPWLDEGGWGFEPPGTTAEQYNRELGVAWGGPKNVEAPKDKRGLSLVRRLPRANTSEFTLYIDGQHWNFWREGGLRMPAGGTVMTLTTAFGEWNAERTEFTQFPGPVRLGDKWRIELRDETEISAGGASGSSASGIMLENSSPMSCVTVHLNGTGVDEIMTTRPDGFYRFDNLPAGSYTIVPFKTGFSFEPAFRDVEVRDGAVEVQPFSARPEVGGGLTDDTLTVAGVRLVKVPAGKFRIGQNGVASPLHQVTLDAFQIAACEITRREYLEVLGGDLANPGGQDDHPVEGVSWYDAVRFCNRLSDLAGLEPCYDLDTWTCDLSRDGFRLPTEAEWEYACRAGSYTNFFPGCDKSDLSGVGWYGEDPAAGGTHPVGGKNPNSWGLYDTHGNVREWCNDWYEDYPADSLGNPTGPAVGSRRVLRGGAWNSDAFFCRSAFREALAPDQADNATGFRIVRRAE